MRSAVDNAVVEYMRVGVDDSRQDSASNSNSQRKPNAEETKESA